ncbi:LytTR family DNA-binding domain-containing protein [Mucilaginibacter sp. SMC90]|uniref:LytR/AlgR family response regulator transcription factor n=1 Tax=Mucilaginibacter sp. SMC90 TaxID=2929803 RepID=UPI001FB333F9|nr:LytTR family DNA-binding domain-containing protein [Mucilaginibacter sp. SMC90]UOE48913.1 LytTR family DNA-binding domain-containing protein [Mucilaginibacter sp. SMC90]
MKIINCIVADDEELARSIIERYIAQLPQLRLVASCSNGAETFTALKNSKADLLFLDIKMPQLSGLELLRSVKNPPPVILTTAFREFALESFELNVIDYLLKPIPFDRFLKAIEKYESLTNPPGLNEPQKDDLTDDIKEAFIYIKADKKMVRVLLKDILFIEGLKDYVQVHTADKRIITYQTLNYFEEKLPLGHFMRVHRSYIISLNHIQSYSASEIEISSRLVPIGSTYARSVLKQLGSEN